MTFDRALFISDLQIPFEAERALKFCQAVCREFKISLDHIYNVGDETDQYFGGMWEKDPNALHTPNTEIAESLDKLRQWYKAFPEMRIATSNHGTRWARKASNAGIPSQLMRSYREIIQAPKTWYWQDSWTIKMDKRPVHMFHGVGYGGMYAYRQAAVDKGMNTVFGHLHSNAGIAPVVTNVGTRWGMNVGCLIDTEAYAFHYGKDLKFKPWLGVGVVMDGGLTPLLIPYERF